MPEQTAVTVRATVLPDRHPLVERELRALRAEGPASPDLPFAELAGVHFARLFVLDGADDGAAAGAADGAGRGIPASLVYMADVDGSTEQHLADLAQRAGHGMDRVFGHCLDYPAAPGAEQRRAWLTRHTLRPAAYYVHTAGRTVEQIRAELRLRDELEDLADAPDLRAGAPGAALVRRRLVDAVHARPDLRWAARPAAGPGRGRAVRAALALGATALLGLLLLPVLVPVLLGWLVLVRLRERQEVPEAGPADPEHLHDVMQYEDFGAQNPFTAVGLVKPGLVRRTTMRVALAGLEFANRHLFWRDRLAGVRTIHFARWLPLDGGRRLVFASAYDGSLESYMDDFIDRLHWGINLVFSNGVGFPRTRWLVFGGARDEIAYKHYLRRHQVATVVFYSAYATATARTLDTNAEIRNGLSHSPRDDASAARWLSLL